MSGPLEDRYPELRPLLDRALATGDASGLETYLAEHSNLPGPRADLTLITVFGDLIAEIVRGDDPPVERLEALLDGWAAMDLAAAPVNHPLEMLPACAALSYGRVGAARPDWWGDEIAKLHRAASDPRWRTREMVAFGLQQMLLADWDRTYAEMRRWLADPDQLVIRAAAAAVGDTIVLLDEERGRAALDVMGEAMRWVEAFPAARRREDDFRTLRKGLGYAVSVAVAAAPEPGFGLLRDLAASADADVRWIVRENLKKNRLAKWPGEVAAVKALLG